LSEAASVSRAFWRGFAWDDKQNKV
jgi:hypothetical protein